MNSKSNHQHRHFFHTKCDLVKCNCPVFRRVKKRIFVNLNANILQSTWWKFLKFFLHHFKLACYKILWLYMSKNVFFLKFGTCPRNDSWECFWWKQSQETLGVKKMNKKFILLNWPFSFCSLVLRAQRRLILYWKTNKSRIQPIFILFL